MNINRSRTTFEEAMKNADYPLFEAICRWVVQDEDYMSMENLVQRVKELEGVERKTGKFPSFKIRKATPRE